MLRSASLHYAIFSVPTALFLRPAFIVIFPLFGTAQKNPGTPPSANRYIHPQNEAPWGAGRSIPTPEPRNLQDKRTRVVVWGLTHETVSKARKQSVSVYKVTAILNLET